MSESNLKIWNELKAVPREAKKSITGGRLKGMTDIKPQWRLKMMTEQFGVIGIGWYYEIVKTWTENNSVSDTTIEKIKTDTFDHNKGNESETPKPITENKSIECKNEISKEISVHVLLNLYIKDGEKWSMPIVGVGGSMLIAIEKYGPHHSDEAYKMATTDALSVAMKQLGVAADVYMGLSDSKYDKPTEDAPRANKAQPFNEYEKSEPGMTTNQKSTLKDLVVELDKIGSERTNKAVIKINELFGYTIVPHDAAEQLIRSCNKLIAEVTK